MFGGVLGAACSPFRCPRTCRRPPTLIPGWLRDSFWQTRHRQQEAGGGLKAPARWGVPSLATGKPWSSPRWEHAAASRPQRPRGARGRPGPLPDVRVRPAADGVRSREEPSSWCRPNCQPAEPRPRPSLLCCCAEQLRNIPRQRRGVPGAGGAGSGGGDGTARAPRWRRLEPARGAPGATCRPLCTRLFDMGHFYKENRGRDRGRREGGREGATPLS